MVTFKLCLHFMSHWNGCNVNFIGSGGLELLCDSVKVHNVSVDMPKGAEKVNLMLPSKLKVWDVWADSSIRFSLHLSVNNERFARLGSYQFDQGEAWNVHERRYCVSSILLLNFNLEGGCVRIHSDTMKYCWYWLIKWESHLRGRKEYMLLILISLLRIHSLPQNFAKK